MTVAVVDDLFCPECGYNLRGIDDIDRCPECGHALDRARLAGSNIPWTHRRDIGVMKAYVRTVAVVIRHPSRVAADVARPVSFDDARLFRRVTVLLAMIGPLAVLAWLAVSVVLDRPITISSTAATDIRLGWLLEILVVPVVIAALYAFLLAAGGVASYFFHPRYLPVERQNRAVALSYYACAPMALTTLSIAAIVGAVLARRYLADDAPGLSVGVLLAAGAAGPALQAFASIAAPVIMLRRATHCGAGRAFALAVMLPVLWTLLAAIIAVGIPAAYLFVAAVIMSLVAS